MYINQLHYTITHKTVTSENSSDNTPLHCRWSATDREFSVGAATENCHRSTGICQWTAQLTPTGSVFQATESPGRASGTLETKTFIFRAEHFPNFDIPKVNIFIPSQQYHQELYFLYSLISTKNLGIHTPLQKSIFLFLKKKMRIFIFKYSTSTPYAEGNNNYVWSPSSQYLVTKSQIQ